MSLILPQLYLSPVNKAQDIQFLKNNGIKFILIAAKGLKKNFPKQITYKQLPISDNPTTLIIKYFVESIEFIENSILHAPVLVHCLGGKSRSATIVISYVMYKQKMKYQAALDYVKKHHLLAYPNPGFLQQLQVWEEVLNKFWDMKLDQTNKYTVLRDIISTYDIGHFQIDRKGQKKIQQIHDLDQDVDDEEVIQQFQNN